MKNRMLYGVAVAWLLLGGLAACGSGAKRGRPAGKTDAGDGALVEAGGGPATDAGDASAPDASDASADAAGDGSADASADGGSGIIDVSGTWDAVGTSGSLAGSSVTCAKTSFVMTQTATQLQIAKRAFSCTYTGNNLPAAVTYPDVTLTISGNQLLDGGQPAGSIDATSVHVNDCLAGSCAVITLTQTQPNRLDYTESASVSGSTESQLSGKLLKEGTYTPGQLDVQPPTVDFGTIAPGASPTQTLTVTNTGGELADNIAASGLSSPVSFAGGSYPGAGGTCSTSLAAGQSCTVVIQAATQASFYASSFSMSLALDYASVGSAYATTVAIQGTEPVIQTSSIIGSGQTIAYGMSVAADGTLALIGTPECAATGYYGGCVDAFVEQGGTWTHAQQLTGSQYFGVGVALSGTQALVETDGTVVPYAWNGTNWVAASQGAFAVSLGSNTDSPEGLSIRMSGNAAVVSSSSNSAFAILAYDGTNWSVASTPSGTWGPATVSGSWIAAGDSAGVHMFHASGGAWTDVQTVSTSSTSLSLDGTTLAVGTPTAVKLYTYGGTSWTLAQTLTDPTSQSGTDYFATRNTLAVRAGHLFVGAPRHSIYVTSFVTEGDVFSSVLGGSTWSSFATFHENSFNNVELGDAVALSGSFALATDPVSGNVAFIPY